MSTKDSMTETAARIGRIVRMDVALDRLVPALSEVERVVERCIFTEAPLASGWLAPVRRRSR
jgi:hypothetical protein